jgi:3-hydroxyisobutyrate dehydrogenase-like beta-hydroxyacid dehydrogenase
MPSDRVGLIGVGLLGTALAERLLSGGFTVLGYDLDVARRAALAQLGGHAVATPAEVIRRCARVLLSLPTTEVVESVIAPLGADLRAGQVVIDTTTGDPERTAALGAALAARGVGYLDASVAGSSVQMRQGDAVLLVGGEPAHVNACADLLACLAREWFHLGPWGSGARMKLAVNLVLGLNRLVLAEGLSFARACGFNLTDALRVLAAGPAYSRVMDTKGPKMIARDFEPQARLAQHLKDVRLIVQEAERTGAKVPASLLHRTLLERLEAAGFGGEDNAAILRAYE